MKRREHARAIAGRGQACHRELGDDRPVQPGEIGARPGHDERERIQRERERTDPGGDDERRREERPVDRAIREPPGEWLPDDLRDALRQDEHAGDERRGEDGPEQRAAARIELGDAESARDGLDPGAHRQLRAADEQE